MHFRAEYPEVIKIYLERHRQFYQGGKVNGNLYLKERKKVVVTSVKRMKSYYESNADNCFTPPEKTQTGLKL